MILQSSNSLNEKRLMLYSLLVLILLFLAGSKFAQAQVTASISGRIEDSSGAAIPGAVVTVTNQETGAARTLTSNEQGNYRALSLPVGHYDVKAEKTGFQGVTQSGITLVVAQEAVVNLKLQVGAVQQEVTVIGEAPVVNTSTASMSGLVGEKEVKDLPLNGRSFDQLITLNAGAINVTSQKTLAPVAPNGNLFSVSGRLPQENLFLMNGWSTRGRILSAVSQEASAASCSALTRFANSTCCKIRIPWNTASELEGRSAL